MKDIELLPCPFCGAACHFEKDAGAWEWVECESCGMQGNRSASLMEDCKPLLAEAWNRRAAVEAGRAQRVPDGWVLIATDAYEAGFGKGEQAYKTGQEIDNPWGDEPGREAWAVGYAIGKERAALASTPAQPAQQEPNAVAYLDIGAGGYMDLGTDMSDEALSLLPKGRHMLVIAGTYGVDGYTAVRHQEPPQQERKPMTEDALVDGFCGARHSNQFVSVFIAGARFAERHHGIKE